MNRFYQTDRSKWTGRGYIGPVASENARDKKRIAHFIFDGPEGSPVARLRAAYIDGLAIVDELLKKRDEVTATRRFTPLGVSEALGEHALTDSIPKLRRARAAVDKIKAELTDRASKLTLTAPNDQQRKEHEEIRSVMRGMSPQQRDAFVRENLMNPSVAAAIAGAIPALSGVSSMMHQTIIAEQLEREHGEALGELRDLDEVVRVAETAVGKAREELRETIGVDRATFEKIAEIGEANGGELPFRIETEIGPDQKPVETAKVFDFAAKRWRNATPDEIRGAA